MYFVYVDESGNRDPSISGRKHSGSVIDQGSLYVLVGLSLFEMRWFQFEHYINRCKLDLLRRIRRREGIFLELADCEVKSSAVRHPAERGRHDFLCHLQEAELTGLVNSFYQQLAYHHMRLFAVIIDKRYLHDYMDQEKLHRKAYELLIERVEWFMRNEHPKHRALLVVDDTSRQMNRSLAMKHSFFQREGTSSGERIGHIVELPMFVASELSNGVQLADLCAYNVYRAFRDRDLDYEFFARIKDRIYRAARRPGPQLEGLKVFPEQSPLCQTVRDWEIMEATGEKE
jgi:hypothetical protein